VPSMTWTSHLGRPSIPPERLLKAQLLIALFSVQGDRLFCELLDDTILFRWFLDMNLDDPATIVPSQCQSGPSGAASGGAAVLQ